MNSSVPSSNKDVLPASVRYVKNGKKSQWWKAAITNGQIHLGWKTIPRETLLKADLVAIKDLLQQQYGSRPGVTQEFNAIRDLLIDPSQHIWITFEDGCLWWCTVRDGVSVNPNGDTSDQGHFWLTCDRPWSKTSIGRKQLNISDLPGTVTVTAGFRATVCKPRGSEAILRLIRDETDPDAVRTAEARRDYKSAIHRVVQRLSPKDFEHLIDLILGRTGWQRISTLGGTREGIDLEAENPATAEIAFVQVKSAASQEVLNRYVERFNKERDRYHRMIFAVHSPTGQLSEPSDAAVQVWTGDRISALIVRLGLGEWVESRLA